MLNRERAYVNPFSNNLVFSKDKIGDAFETINSLQLPLKCAPQFMHETTHHWCFSSPVGHAVSMLSGHARKKSLETFFFTIDHERNESIAIRCDTIARAFVYFFQPLSEGLALFAEHDVISEHTSIISQPTAFAAMFFGGIPKDLSRIYKLLNSDLYHSRTDRKHIRSKAALLLQPLTCSNGGYLPGYLLIKNMRVELTRRYAKFWDSDFYLHFLKCHFFDDWELVGILLDMESDEEIVLNNIITHLDFKLAQLFKRNLSMHLDEFERHGYNANPVQFEYRKDSIAILLNSFPTIRSNTEKGQKALRDFLEIHFDDSKYKVANPARYMQTMLLNSANSITLAYDVFQATVTDNRKIRLCHKLSVNDDQFVVELDEQQALPPGFDAEVEVSLVVAVQPPGLYIFIHQEGELKHCLDYSNNKNEVPAHLKNDFSNIDNREAYTTLTTGIIKSIFEKKGISYSDGKNGIFISMSKSTEAFYLSKCFAYTSDSLLDVLKKEMKVEGFRTIFKDDMQLVYDIAALSIACANHSIQRRKDGTGEWAGEKSLELINDIYTKKVGHNAFFKIGERMLSVI